MSQTYIKNVRLVDPSQNLDKISDILFADGKIQAIDRDLSKLGSGEVLDGTGKVLVPGFVDLHCHLREPGFEERETIESGTQSAAAGGFTTVCCMANTNPVNDRAAITRYILERAADVGSVRVLPIGAITEGLKGEHLAEIAELKEAGCIAISDDGNTVMDAKLMRLAMDYAKGFDLPVMTHSIDQNLARGSSMHEGDVSCRLGLTGMPSAAEDVIVARDIILSELTGCHLHVGHVSTEGGVELIRQAKAKGVPVTAEVTPHHFTLTDEACSHYDTHAKMCPPLRSERHRQALIAGLADGTLDVIATDHAPHTTVGKEVEFDLAAFGIIGFETAFALAYRLVLDKHLTLNQLIEKMTARPMQIIGRDFKGIRVGAVADLCLLDLNKKWTYQVSDGFSKGRNSPFDGDTLQGKVIATWVNGKKVYS